MSQKRSRLVYAVLALVTATTPVLAQPAISVVPAVELSAADKAAKAKDWASALAHYQTVVQQAGVDPKVQQRAHVGAADALYQLGRITEAYDAYDELQRAFGAKLALADKNTVTARLKDLATKTGSLSLHVEEAGADVELDGKSLGVSPLAALIRVAVGPHDVHVTKTGFVPFNARADVAPDVKATVDVVLVRQATQGHVVVSAPGGEALRVIIDGVDLGATPWEGDLPAGLHEVTGRSSAATATAQTITVVAGDRAQVSLATTATAGHVQVRTSDGKGLVYLDGVIKGEGAFAGDVASGPHVAVVTREGYERYEKAFTLGPRETWAETVTLKAVASATAGAQVAERQFAGVYGGFGLAGLFGIGGEGTELETNCNTLGATTCDTPGAVGGGAFGYVGYTWDPVGFEVMLAASGDTTTQTAHFTGDASPVAQPNRDEKFTIVRAGGLAAFRVRATLEGKIVRGTVAGGVGFAYRYIAMERTATTLVGDAHDVYVPASVGYMSPGISAEAAVQIRVSPTVALSVGALLWAENASIAGTNATPRAADRTLLSQNPPIDAPYPTPQYHLATGPQVFLGPFVGMQFGP